MSETELQRALIYLYANVDEYFHYEPELFAGFSLDYDESQLIKQLVTEQRAGLVLQGELLREKRRDLIIEALPASATLARDCLISLLATFQVRERFGNHAATISAFSGHVSNACAVTMTPELELVRFESVYASVAFIPPSAGRTFALVKCSFDACATAHSLLWPETVVPYCYLLFKSLSGRMRVLELSPHLADVLGLFERGLTKDEVMQTLESDQQRAMAAESINKLVAAGVPIA